MGIPVEDLYKSLDATRLAQYFESHPTQRKVYQRSLIGAGYVGGIAGLLYAEKLGIEAYYERKDREQKEQRQREQRPPSEQNKPQVQVPIGRTN